MNRKSLNAISILLVSLVALSMHAAPKTRETKAEASIVKAIRKDILAVAGSDLEAETALEKIAAHPRDKVLQVLKEEFGATPNVPSLYLRVAVAIEARELAEELKTLARKSDAWAIFVSINRIFDGPGDDAARSEFAKIYLTRLQQLPMSSKVAVLDGLRRWKTVVPKDVYVELLADKGYEVRGAAVSQFIESRERLPASDQSERFRLALQMKPYQVRLEAMDALASLPAKERQGLKGAVPKDLCEKETQARVRESCKRLMESIKSKPGGAA